MDNGYNKYMMLKIRSASKSDFGSYKCVAKNSLGETDGLIKLDGELTCVSFVEFRGLTNKRHVYIKEMGLYFFH
jgi:hypothetical protein